MRQFETFKRAEQQLLKDIMLQGSDNPETRELISYGFSVKNPLNNQNTRSNYEYAQVFFQWLISGGTDLSSKVLDMNPSAAKFLDTTGLPESFNSSYGHKIKSQLESVVGELRRHPWSRRAYFQVLQLSDNIILGADTTHEYPCTIGLQLLVRGGRLNMCVNMRSNNAWSVLPYDVFNFTMLQVYLAESVLNVGVGDYYHHSNSLHLFHRDIDRVVEYLADNQPSSKESP